MEISDKLTKLKDLLEELYNIHGEIINTTNLDTECVIFVTPKFILDIYDPPNEYATVSFTINNYKIMEVAELMRLLTLFFGEDLVVIEDNFVDTKSEEVFYGDKAYEKFQEHIHTRNGFTTCPICEGLASKEMWLPDKGYCVVCDTEAIPYMTFH
jgi:hypothetical protein